MQNSQKLQIYKSALLEEQFEMDNVTNYTTSSIQRKLKNIYDWKSVSAFLKLLECSAISRLSTWFNGTHVMSYVITTIASHLI